LLRNDLKMKMTTTTEVGVAMDPLSAENSFPNGDPLSSTDLFKPFLIERRGTACAAFT
jgi:hypothetical protein